LENTYNAEDLKERDERAYKVLSKTNPEEKIFYRIEPKFDGLAVELIYER
jgi:NAD-dependent DNA ligase